MTSLHKFEYPNKEHVHQVAKSLDFSIHADDEDEYLELMRHTLSCYEAINSFEHDKPELKYPRSEISYPEDNKYNAWFVKSEIVGNKDPNTKLFGKTIAIKDNISVAQLPLINGTDFLQDNYTPDAEVVTRVLDAGAIVTGKAHCEYLCQSASSFTNATGPVLNPHNTEYSSGGSSSGCAVLVATNQVDMAIGGDQGGSIRIPSSWCGIYGMKPTYGLVPYTGAMGLEQSLDHLGPMTRTVTDNALLLEVLAGDDGNDPRQRKSLPVGQDYTSTLHGDPKQLVSGMKVGILKEGFLGIDPESDQIVRNAIDQLQTLGVTVEEVSIPMHNLASAICDAIFTQGFTNDMHGGGRTGHRGVYDINMDQALRQHKSSMQTLHDTVKVVLMSGEYMKLKYGTMYYGKAHNLAIQLRRAYDDMLSKYDLLIMPTVAMRPTKLPKPGNTRKTDYILALEMCVNASAFNASGHPAMSVPCGVVEGLPIGMMIIGKYFHEKKIYELAYAFEQSIDWRTI